MFKWIGTQIEWLKGFFQEPNGKSSIKRLIMFWVSFSFLQSYFRISWATQTLQDMPQNWMFLFAGILGLGILDKYITQNKKE